MEDLGVFPFGQKVKKVEQKDRIQKNVFVLGVYASAVHAKWFDNNGKTLANALAVASEPEIFWRGDKSETIEIIDRIKLPEEAGYLLPAATNFNGPSGTALDDKFLKPLGMGRKDCWLCDLVPYSMKNPKQESALQRTNSIFEKYGLNKGTLKEASRENRQIEDNRIYQILDEIKLSKAEYLITLGNEPIKYFLKKFDKSVMELQLTEKYGNIKNIIINGLKLNWIPLVHPRQAAGLGNHSKEWFDKHAQWESLTAPKLKKLLSVYY